MLAPVMKKNDQQAKWLIGIFSVVVLAAVILSAAELAVLGNTRGLYFILLATHIILAATSLPFILFTAYRGLTGEYEDHKRKAKRMWPIWFYVAVTGPMVYMMIKPYYS